jgi:hypothetical protein
MWLTAEEVHDLTGYDRFADQRRWLLNHAWTFVVSATGRPIVARSYAETQMGSQQPRVKTWEPDLRAIR